MDNSNLYVITGGPGCGKTAVLLDLQKRGFRCAPEVARRIIQEQVEMGSDAVPWGNQKLYTKLMLDRSVESYLQHTPATKPTFSDRGIPDCLCYAWLIGLAEQDALKRACDQYRYAQRVFFAPAWQEIYGTDTERKQDFAEAVRTAELMRVVYDEHGYKVIDLPKVSVNERTEFILKNLR